MSDEQQFFQGVRVKLLQAAAISRLPEWLDGYQEFDSARLPASDRAAMLTAYHAVAQIGEIATVAGVHTWPDRVDYLVRYEDGCGSIVPPEAIEFFDFGNIILVPMSQLPNGGQL
jgi:hypothetical protein